MDMITKATINDGNTWSRNKMKDKIAPTKGAVP